MNQEQGHEHSPIQLARRDLLRRGLLAAGSLGALSSGALGLSAQDTEAAIDPDLHDLDGMFASSCPLTPSDVEGPFWLNLALLRRDITEGLLGVPLIVIIQVIDAATCSPIPNAVVDVWHDNPDGEYSGFASQGTAGQTFLRGIQVTNAVGAVRFKTIYPGWYPGRTPHLHVKINPNATSELTTQLYLSDDFSERIFTGFAPYDTRGSSPVKNNTDAFFNPELQVFLSARSNGPGLVARMRVVIS